MSAAEKKAPNGVDPEEEGLLNVSKVNGEETNGTAEPKNGSAAAANGNKTLQTQETNNR